MSKLWNFRPVIGLVMTLLMLSLLLAACGDSTATSPAASTSPTPAVGANISVPAVGGTATTAANATTAATTTTKGGDAFGTTPAATTAANATTVAGATTAAGAATGGTNVVPVGQEAVGPCRDASAPATTPAQPTPTDTNPAQLPSLVYNSGSVLTAQPATNQSILSNINGNNPQFTSIIGKITVDTIGYYTSGDSYDTVVAYYTKLLEGAGWQQLHKDSDATSKSALIGYQKGGSKIVITVETITDPSKYPTEFTQFLAVGKVFILVLSGVAKSANEPTPIAIPGTPVPALQAGQHPYATIEMEKGGTIVIELCPNLAPVTVENFEKLITKGFYNGLTFHRVEAGFVVQGGDPQGNGQGGPGYNIPGEFTTDKKHDTGTVAMARTNDPNSAGSQFYICLAPQPSLDGQYAVFGQVISGMDVVNKIVVGDKMKSVTLSVK